MEVIALAMGLIIVDAEHSGIDYTKLDHFDWEAYQGTFLERQALLVLEFCKTSQLSFPRKDYHELHELVYVWLSGEMPRDKFRFKESGAHHQARFMAQDIYTMKYALLLSQIPLISSNDNESVGRLVLCIGLLSYIPVHPLRISSFSACHGPPSYPEDALFQRG